MKTYATLLAYHIKQGRKFTTREMCLYLGWQGGTIHQVAQETGLDLITLLDAQP